MREQKQRKVRKDEETEAETAPKDLTDAGLDQETSEVLDDIACCLAEIEDDNLAAKKAAKAEWDELLRQHHASEMSTADLLYQRQAWALKYAGIIPMIHDCCATLVPDFSGLE